MSRTLSTNLLIDSLYHRVAYLESRASSVALPDHLGSMCVEATLRCLTRHNALETLNDEELRKAARRILNKIWERKTKVLYARYYAALLTGRTPSFLSLEALCDTRFEPSHTDSYNIENLLELVRSILLAEGYSRELICVFLWRIAHGMEWDEVRLHFESRFEQRMTSAALRKLASRKFPLLCTLLQAKLLQYGIPP